MDLSLVRCAKCEKVLNNCAIIYSTPQCGHLFHEACLRTLAICPQCGSACYRRYHRRIYPEFSSYNWMYIDIQTTKLDGEDWSAFALELGTTQRGHSIYSARLCGKAETTPIYYVPDDRNCFQDIACACPCNSLEISLGIEILDIRHDKDAQYKTLIAEVYKQNRESNKRKLKRSESVRNG